MEMSYIGFHFLYARVQSQKLLNLPKERLECDLVICYEDKKIFRDN